VARDAAGNLFIAESNRNRIRRVDAASGTITTVAGTGARGFGGDGGPATSAMLAGPTRLALDGAGTLFIADVGNGRIRRVDVFTGLISTVAGNGGQGFGGEGVPAVMASFDHLRGVAADATGNLFIADGQNRLSEPPCNEERFPPEPLCGNRIRRVDAATGIITTVAGGPGFGSSTDGGPAGGASFSGLTGLSIDAAGNLYIGDSGLSPEWIDIVTITGNRIRRIDAATGIITTVAGNGTNGFEGDGGLATAANISVPTSFALDAEVNLFFIDSGNNRVRRIDAASGIITSVAGDGVRHFGGDLGPPSAAGLNLSADLATGAPTEIYIADTGNRRVRLIEGSNSPPQAVITGGGLAECSDSRGHLFHLDGSESIDVDSSPGSNDDIVTFAWFASFGTPSQEMLGTGPALELFHPTGGPPRAVTLRVIDRSGEAGTQTTSLAVQDTAPPQLTIASLPSLLWPPNHRLVDVAFAVTAVDQCGPASVTLAAVTSSEADDAAGGGDGTTMGDIQGAELGSPDFDIALRAERDASGTGRRYTVTYVAVDASGNAASVAYDLIVPHDQGGMVDHLTISLLQDSRGTVLDWSDVPGALFYTVVRGEVGRLREVGDHVDLGTLTCIEAVSHDTDTHESPDRDAPGPGAAYFYLVEYNDGLRGGFGEESAPWPRDPSAGGCQ
jgi:sugar lactone lactonase YvrE